MTTIPAPQSVTCFQLGVWVLMDLFKSKADRWQLYTWNDIAHALVFTWVFRGANWASRLLCRNTFRVARHGVFDGDALAEWFAGLVETPPISEGQSMCATICVSIKIPGLKQFDESREYGYFGASKYEWHQYNYYKYAPDLWARQKSNKGIGTHRLDTRLVFRLSFSWGKCMWYSLESELLP